MSELLYGFDGDEQLEHNDPDEVVREHLDDLWDSDRCWAECVSTVKWPLRVLEFRRMKPTPGTLAESALDDVLMALDEEYADHDGNPTEPTEGMKAAAKAFVDAVLAEYVVWAHEPTGKVLEYTEEQARKIWEVEV